MCAIPDTVFVYSIKLRKVIINHLVYKVHGKLKEFDNVLWTTAFLDLLLLLLY